MLGRDERLWSWYACCFGQCLRMLRVRDLLSWSGVRWRACWWSVGGQWAMVWLLRLQSWHALPVSCKYGALDLICGIIMQWVVPWGVLGASAV